MFSLFIVNYVAGCLYTDQGKLSSEVFTEETTFVHTKEILKTNSTNLIVVFLTSAVLYTCSPLPWTS